MPTPVTSVGPDTITITPPPEPFATFAVIERTMVGTAGLLSLLQRHPAFSSELHRAFDGLIDDAKGNLQVGVIRLARETAGKGREQ